jgi:hypothetical protein
VHDGEWLFSGGRLRDGLEEWARALASEIEKASEDHALHADEDAWVQALASRYSVATPRLRDDQVWMDPPEEVKVDVRYDYGRRAIMDMSRPALVAGTRNVVHIPFEGDADVFKLSPSTGDFNPPQAELHQDELVRVFESPNDAPIDLRGEVASLIASLNKYLTWAGNEIDAFNDTLEQRARAWIQARRARLRESYDRAAESGIPIGRAGGAPKTYMADVIVRRPSPMVPRRTEMPIPLEPVISDTIFEHILEIIRAASLQMERTPRSYEGMDEEARRDVILTALNTHYAGQASGEAFNKQGRTDILVRVENRNVFIGECKFWSGVKSLAEALDQLFRYAAWRDTKLCLVVFVREKGLTEIIEKARAALQGHPSFRERRDAPSETELRAVVAWPGDDDRLADLNLFIVHTPPPG